MCRVLCGELQRSSHMAAILSKSAASSAASSLELPTKRARTSTSQYVDGDKAARADWSRRVDLCVRDLIW